MKLKKDPSGGKAPAPYLTPSGPDMDFKVRLWTCAAVTRSPFSTALWTPNTNSICLLVMMQLRRTEFASSDLWKQAIKQPIKNKTKKKKNHTTNLFGETLGRLHLDKQNIDARSGKKSKALRLAERAEKEEDRAATENELQQEAEEMGSEFQQAYGFSRDDMA